MRRSLRNRHLSGSDPIIRSRCRNGFKFVQLRSSVNKPTFQPCQFPDHSSHITRGSRMHLDKKCFRITIKSIIPTRILRVFCRSDVINIQTSIAMGTIPKLNIGAIFSRQCTQTTLIAILDILCRPYGFCKGKSPFTAVPHDCPTFLKTTSVTVPEN